MAFGHVAIRGTVVLLLTVVLILAATVPGSAKAAKEASGAKKSKKTKVADPTASKAAKAEAGEKKKEKKKAQGGKPKSLAEEVTEMGADLACSACSHATQSLRFMMGSKIKKSMKDKAKRSAASAAMGEACDVSRFPGQLAIFGDEGKREYKDFQELIRKGGSISNLNMSPENNAAIANLCKAVVNHMGGAIVEKAATHKDRVGGFNWERWVCVDRLALCDEPLLDKSEEEEDEERSEEDL
mmetsp:Transcript_96055/g.222685  ORF Transcript_96055/g.222685 Transcript_96055/m.222685 type:complete len:241 (-) Transcript_96055:78-800(-)|eukprot:CAMPEP_0171098338 /NCGR_PEP_ID=MMETSP0766_2-20121228/48062_1 /TAXON_ID=439317 /ORGANISM="Gambierdiscus australes, Strain CAWD 149" /LENGTH=240 /DNA_ID=CAMNT_0011557663 /DNA_START=31 /DNA_END=753 /DNA_ORIENTATION=-